MPVRIYDLARKLGIESKAVIAKARELGIPGAKVPSSSLDKITAEYLEQQLGGHAPEVVDPAPPKAPEPIVIVTAPEEPEEPEEPQPEIEEEPAIAVVVAADGSDSEQPSVAEGVETLEPETEEVIEEKEEQEALPEPELQGPKVGDKVGFIKLPPRPAFREERFKGRTVREKVTPAQKPAANAKAIKEIEVEPKFLPPTDGELIILKPPVVVRDLAGKLHRKPFQLIADLMELNVFANVNQAVDEITAQQLCAKYGFRFELEKRERGGGVVRAPRRNVELDQEDKLEELQLRAPVVTIMGHVDHGKTTLLDVIRHSNVVAKEAGGITQHIGAYTISIPHPDRPKQQQQITFLDTPGHAAFSSMRARGANVTDIIILVVAADDGPMPQTLEALDHARAANVPIIVAVNKCDHPAANPMKSRQQLQDRGLVCEEWGGDTIFVDISALKNQGVDKLLEMILLQAEVMELKANPNRKAKGNVIESGVEPGGPTATLLIRKGCLKVGNVVICGAYWGKVRALINEEGNRLKEAGPSVAVKMLGLNGVPQAGLEFSSVENDKSARALAEERQESGRKSTDRRPKVTLENLFATMAEDSAKELKIVVKADTQGSAEAIVEALGKIKSEKVSLDVIHTGVGTISDSDVLLASASKAIVIGFHTRVDSGANDTAKREVVQIKQYSIIYELIDEVKDAMTGLLDPELKEVILGSTEVRKVFPMSRGGTVAGCYVTNGRIARGQMRVFRKERQLFEGTCLSLRRFQDEVNEVRAGIECGIRLDGFNDFEEGDSIECFHFEKTAAQL